MTRPSAWTLCRKRVASMCKAYGIVAELHTGNGRCGVSYSITFRYAAQELCELRDRSPSRLFDKLCAFHEGMMTRSDLLKLR